MKQELCHLADGTAAISIIPGIGPQKNKALGRLPALPRASATQKVLPGRSATLDLPIIVRLSAV